MRVGVLIILGLALWWLGPVPEYGSEAAAPSDEPVPTEVLAPEAPDEPVPTESPEAPLSLDDGICVMDRCTEIACRLSQPIHPDESAAAGLTLADGSKRMVLLAEPDIAWLWIWESGSGTLSIPGYQPADIRWVASDGESPGICIPSPVPLRDSTTSIAGKATFPGAVPDGRVYVSVEGCGGRTTVGRTGEFRFDVRPGRCQLKVEGYWTDDPPEGQETYTQKREDLGHALVDVEVAEGEELVLDIPLIAIDTAAMRHAAAELTRLRTSPRPGHVAYLDEHLDADALRERIAEWGCPDCTVEIDDATPAWDIEVFDRIGEPAFGFVVEEAYSP